jgi:hypothetical protein
MERAIEGMRCMHIICVRAALPLGLVDVKVCVVDDIHSGFKLVMRKYNRK